MRNRRFPKYPDDSDYTTNSPSYYDDLARKQKLIEMLAKKIWEYEETLDLTLEEITNRLESYIEENDNLMTDRLAQITNRLESYIEENDDLMNERLEQWDLNLEKFPENVELLLQQWLSDGTLDHIINETIFNWKADKTYVDSEIERLDQEDENITSQVEHTDSKLPHVSIKDFPRLEGETDDSERINRAINSIDKGIVQLYGETYVTTQPVKLKTDIIINGTGKNTTVIKNIGGTNVIETIDPDIRYYYAEVNNLTLDGTEKANQVGLNIPNMSYFRASNIWVKNVDIGIYMLGRTSDLDEVLGCYYNYIDNPLISNTNIGIFFDSIANENVVLGGKIMTSGIATIMGANSCKFFGTAFEGNYDTHVEFRNYQNSLFGCRFEGFKSCTGIVNNLRDDLSDYTNFVYTPHFQGLKNIVEDIQGQVMIFWDRGLEIPLRVHDTALKANRKTGGPKPLVDMRSTGTNTTYLSTREKAGNHFEAVDETTGETTFRVAGNGNIFSHVPNAGLNLTSSDGSLFRIIVNDLGELEIIKIS